MQQPRIVATGGGVIAGPGGGWEAFEQGLYSGQPAASIDNLDPSPWLGNKGIRVLDRAARLLCIAAQIGLTSAGISQDPASDGDPDLGLVTGTMFGALHSIASFDWTATTDGPKRVNPMEFPNTVINSPAGQAAIKFKLRGVNSTITAGLASGLYAIHYAAEFLVFGRARVLLAGGHEELCEESAFGFSKLGNVTPGEGSALFVLERLADAQARGAEPWFEIAGFGGAHDAQRIDGYELAAAGAEAAIRQALDSAGIQPHQLACIILSANGDRIGDEMEARALSAVCGDSLAAIPTFAPKSVYGEAMGASGALGVAAAMLALRKQSLPPAVPVNGEYALINAFACDGNNAALVIRQWTK